MTEDNNDIKQKAAEEGAAEQKDIQEQIDALQKQIENNKKDLDGRDKTINDLQAKLDAEKADKELATMTAEQQAQVKLQAQIAAAEEKALESKKQLDAMFIENQFAKLALPEDKQTADLLLASGKSHDEIIAFLTNQKNVIEQAKKEAMTNKTNSNVDYLNNARIQPQRQMPKTESTWEL